MAGPQFFHIQTYARKANKAGQSVEQVLAEAGREPKYSRHVAVPRPYRVVTGLSPQEVQQRHDEMIATGGVTVTLKGGKTARRGIRKDRHTLLTAVASHPHLTSQIDADPLARADYEAWVERNVRFLRDLFGDRLVSVIEHVDEEYPHLHAYILPLDDPTCSARDLNPCWIAKSAAEAAARTAGETDKTAVKLGNDAYRARARELQDQYHEQVGLASGLTRTGPKRERLSRAQWRARKDEAVRIARTHQQMERMVAGLVDREDALTASTEEMARDLVVKLDQAEALFAEAADEKVLAVREQSRAMAMCEREAAAHRAAAEEEAKRIRFSAEKEADRITACAEAIRLEARQQAEEKTREFLEARQAFENQKSAVVQRATKEAVTVVVQVIAGVLTGGVGLKPDRSGWFIQDDDLRQSVQRLRLGNALADVVTMVSDLWGRLMGRLSSADLAVERQEAVKTARTLGTPPSTSRDSGGFAP